MTRKRKVDKSNEQSRSAKGLLQPPVQPKRDDSASENTTRAAMDELLDETFNSDSLDDGHSLVGLDDINEESAAEVPVLAGPTAPQALAQRYKKLRENQSFWDDVERVEDNN